MFRGVRYYLMAAMLAVCFGCGGPATADNALTYTALTQDERLSVSVSRQLVRTAFTTFCASARDEVCDELENYDIHVSVSDGERPVIIWFLMGQATSSTDRTAREFGCELLSDGLNCGSTRPRHAWDPQ